MSEHTSTRTTFGVVTREQQDREDSEIYAASDTAQDAINTHRESVADMLTILDHAKREGWYGDSQAEMERKYTSDAVDIVGVVQRVETIHTVWTRVDREGDSDV